MNCDHYISSNTLTAKFSNAHRGSRTFTECSRVTLSLPNSCAAPRTRSLHPKTLTCKPFSLKTSPPPPLCNLRLLHKCPGVGSSTAGSMRADAETRLSCCNKILIRVYLNYTRFSGFEGASQNYQESITGPILKGPNVEHVLWIPLSLGEAEPQTLIPKSH